MCRDLKIPYLQPPADPGENPTKIVGVFIDRHQLRMPEFSELWRWITGRQVMHELGGGQQEVKYAINRIYLDTLTYSTLPFTHELKTFPPLDAESESDPKPKSTLELESDARAMANWATVVAHVRQNPHIHLHAWIKTFYAGPPGTFEKNIFLKNHREWQLKNGSSLLFNDPDATNGSEWLDPGKHAQFMQAYNDMVLLLKKYPFSSIDLDFIRYPKPPHQLPSNTASYQRNILDFVKNLAYSCKTSLGNGMSLGIINHPYNVALNNMQAPLSDLVNYAQSMETPGGFYPMFYSNTYEQFRQWFEKYEHLNRSDADAHKPAIEYAPINYASANGTDVPGYELIKSIQLCHEAASGSSIFLPGSNLNELGKAIGKFRMSVDKALDNIDKGLLIRP